MKVLGDEVGEGREGGREGGRECSQGAREGNRRKAWVRIIKDGSKWV